MVSYGWSLHSSWLRSFGDKGEYKAWFCPCHGSHYDTSGRVRKGPAPKNLEIPKYEFVDNNTIKIGYNHE